MKPKVVFGVSALLSVVLLSTIASSVNVTTALSSIEGNYSLVYAYYANDSDDYWKRYIPGGATNDLTSMDVAHGYWVRVNVSSETLEVTGTVPSSTTITLSGDQGTYWNLIGFPSTTTTNITTALTGIDGSFTLVYLYNASDTSDTWKRYIPGGATNDLLYMYPGYGYWIKINVSSANLTITN